MKIERTKVPGVMIFTPEVYEDNRGYFTETAGMYHRFFPMQANQSLSKKGVIRGLHYQTDVAKLVWVAQGAIHDVAMNPQTGEWVGTELSAKNHKQMLIPTGYAHGFQALEDNTIVCYLMDDYYDATKEGGFNPSTVTWPLAEQIISDKDKNAMEWSSENKLYL